MRVCPKCGYIDNPLWQQCLFNRDLTFMRYDGFQTLFAKISERFENGENDVEEGLYIYRLPKSKIYVNRRRLHK